MTTTHFAPEEVMAWMDGELADLEAQTVETHVAECAECGAVAAQFRGMSEELGEWRVEEVPERVEQGVMSAVARRAKGVTPRQTLSDMGHPRMWRWIRWGMGFGGAVAAAVVLLVVVSPRSHERTVSQYGISQPKQFDHLELKSKLQPAPNAPAPAAMNGPIAASMDGTPVSDKAAVVSEIDEGLHAPQKLAKARGQLSENLKDVGMAGAMASPGVQPNAPMIARAVSLTVRVKDVEAARPAVEAVLARHRGYAAQMNANSAEGSARGFTASLRVPATELGAALQELRGLGRVDNESQSGEEVTQQHQDLVARLKNARETEVRMQAILQQRTGRISDVLEVEQEIARVRGEIESMEAEQAGLEHRVDFASVDLTLVEEYKAQFAAPDSVGTRVRNSFVAGCRSAWDTVLGVVLFCEEVGPALLVWGVILAVPVFFVRRRYRRMLVGAGSRY